jgi:hypothetical protein
MHAVLRCEGLNGSGDHAAGDRMVPRELPRLRTPLPAQVDLLVVGPAADAHLAVPGELGRAPLIGLAMLRTRLRALRDTAPPTVEAAD